MQSDAKCLSLRQNAAKLKDRLTISISQAEYQELRALAKKYSVSMAWLGRQSITHFLEQYKQKEIQLPLNLKQRTKI